MFFGASACVLERVASPSAGCTSSIFSFDSDIFAPLGFGFGLDGRGKVVLEYSGSPAGLLSLELVSPPSAAVTSKKMFSVELALGPVLIFGFGFGLEGLGKVVLG